MRGLQTLVLGALMFCNAAAFAEATALADVDIPSDDASVRRGAETVATVCNNCHSLKYIKYRDLLSMGVDRDTLKLWMGDKDLNAPLLAQMPADMARASFGKVPPDLSLMTAARTDGGRYVYSLLTGFYNAEDGTTNNHVFPGITMPDVLGYSFAGSDEIRRQIGQTATDVAAFLVWAAEPSAGFRVKLGSVVMIYLIIMTALLWLWKRRIWKDVDHGVGHSVGGS